MKDYSKSALVVASIAIVIAIGGYFFPQVSKTLGAVTPGTRFPHGISIGLPANSPTNIGDIKSGSCNLISSAFTGIAASSSLPYDCAVAGVVSTDQVFAQFATSSSPYGGWLITGAAASSTAGFITINAVNNTGGAAVMPASVASTTKYFIVKTQ